MPNPSRDEIAMAVVRAIYGAEDRVKRGELVPPKDDADETRWTLFLGEIAPPVVAVPAPLTFGPIGPVEREWVGPPRSGTFLKVLPDPPVPHGVTHIPMPQNVPNEPPEWMTTTGKSGWRDNSIGALMDSCADVLRDLTTPTPDQPKEGDDNE